jgi:nitrite reductase (NADH) small subunit
VVVQKTQDTDGLQMLVGRIDDFTVGEFKLVQIRNREIGVYRGTDGRWFGVRNLCPHRGAPLCAGIVGGTFLPSDPDEFIYGMEGEVLRCPWHFMEFSLITGESLFGASRLHINVHSVELRGDEVWVDARPRDSRHGKSTSEAKA